MQIVIDIPEQMYLNAKTDKLCGANILVNAIKNGTPLSDVATNGDMFLFANKNATVFKEEKRRVQVILDKTADISPCAIFNKDWWNAYTKEVENDVS